MKEKSFEDKLKELEELSGLIKSGEMPLEKTVENFERGMKLAGELESEMTTIERKVEILVSSGETEPKFQDFREE